MDLVVHAAPGRASRAGARVPRGERRADLGAARGARLDGRRRRGGARRRRAQLPRGGRAARGGGSRAPPRARSGRRPRLLPFLPADDQAAVAAGDASWTLALGPLVPDLDTATHVAVVGGDTIWELDGGEREVLATSDESRPLGVLSGGEAGRALCGSEVLPVAADTVARDPRSRGGRRRRPRARADVAYVSEPRAVRPADRLVPGRLAPARELARGGRARALARMVGRVVRRRTTSPRRRSRRPRRRRTPRTPPWPRASARSRRTGASASRGSTCCTGSTSARSRSRPGRRPRRSCAARSPTICSTQHEKRDREAGASGGERRSRGSVQGSDDGLPAQRPGHPAPRGRARTATARSCPGCRTRAGTVHATRTSPRARSGSPSRCAASASRTATASAR